MWYVLLFFYTVDIDIVEDGMSFEENAEIKARSVARILTNDIVLADDSGPVSYTHLPPM